ncbi:MAG: DUF1937 family protein [Reyranella sp.]|uniref:DUF1937 family protein n=1 Tax=Reyranella sp. TaxID=1929291 RepID=UPI001AC2778D|nr:DUF1937 family protein [Reyranella sp.]MBN9087940.1 DUF1937 family protein [Reyranella sp.]
MWIMIAGPYRAGGASLEQQTANLRVLNEAAVALHRAGHVPVIGVNMALPMIEAAGNTAAAYEELMAPVSLALVERCDTCLRIGGPSRGADDEVDLFEAAGKPVYRALSEVPPP